MLLGGTVFNIIALTGPCTTRRRPLCNSPPEMAKPLLVPKAALDLYAGTSSLVQG